MEIKEALSLLHKYSGTTCWTLYRNTAPPKIAIQVKICGISGPIYVPSSVHVPPSNHQVQVYTISMTASGIDAFCHFGSSYFPPGHYEYTLRIDDKHIPIFIDSHGAQTENMGIQKIGNGNDNNNPNPIFMPMNNTLYINMPMNNTLYINGYIESFKFHKEPDQPIESRWEIMQL